MSLTPVFSSSGKVSALAEASGAELSCYASGDGTLGLCWSAYDADKKALIATGRPVEAEEARQLLEALKFFDPTSWLGWTIDAGMYQIRFLQCKTEGKES